jgi:hypothetical protein
LNEFTAKEMRRMAEILSYAEIEQRYDGQWVIIASTKMNDDLGEVLAHSQSEVEIYQMLPLALRSTNEP